MRGVFRHATKLLSIDVSFRSPTYAISHALDYSLRTSLRPRVRCRSSIFAIVVFSSPTGTNILEWGYDPNSAAMLMLIVAIGGLMGCIAFWASLDPETAKQPERSRMTSLVTGLAMGLLLGGLVASLGTSIFGLGPANPKVDLAVYPFTPPVIPYTVQAPTPIAPVIPPRFELVEPILPPESGK